MSFDDSRNEVTNDRIKISEIIPNNSFWRWVLGWSPPTKTKSTLEFPNKMRKALFNTASRLKVNVEGDYGTPCTV